MSKNGVSPRGGFAMSRLVFFCAGARLETLPTTKVRNILVNVVDSGINDRAINNTKELFWRAGAKTIMCDSGGYQIRTAEKKQKKMTFDPNLPLMRSKSMINISPDPVVEVVCKLQPQPAIMTALDYPIRELSKVPNPEQEFRRKLEFNIKWAWETALLREKHCPHIQLFIPVQCYNLDQFETFWNSIKGIRFDGLSLPIRNMKPSELAIFLLHFHQIGIRKVHILGSSSFFRIAIAAYFARHFFEWVSFDATTWRIAAEKRNYLNPDNLLAKHIGSKAVIDERLSMTCQCPFCTNTTLTDVKNLPDKEKLHFLRNHNFWVTERLAQEMFEKAETWLTLEGFLRQRGRRTREIAELVHCLYMVELLKNEDINVLKPLLGDAA
jgi:tRNA-guanine family transglycosylase